MSARLPDKPNAFLINDYSDLFHSHRLERLVKSILDGTVPAR